MQFLRGVFVPFIVHDIGESGVQALALNRVSSGREVGDKKIAGPAGLDLGVLVYVPCPRYRRERVNLAYF